MAISSIASSLNTKFRMSGMSSGLDTDTIIKQMMALETAKIDKVLQKKELSVWRTDAYRDITSTLQSFYKTYFDPLSSTNLKSASSLASFAASYATSTSTDYINVTPGADAKAGTYSITDITLATAASKLAGSSVTESIVEGVNILNTAAQGISTANDNNKFVFTFNSKAVTFTLDDAGPISSVADLQTKLQTKINEAFGSGKVTVNYTANGAIGGKLSFSTPLDTSVFKIGTAYNTGSSVLFGTAPTIANPLILDGGNNKFELTIDGVKNPVVVPTGTYSDASSLITALTNAANTAFGSANITFEEKDGKIAYTSTKAVSVAATKTATNSTLGLNPYNLSNKLDLNEKISNINFRTPFVASANFVINGKTVTFDSATMSINDIMKKVNSDSSLNATMNYDVTSNKFTIKSNSTGDASNLTVSGNLMTTLGLVCSENGTDAKINVNGQEIIRPSNNFSYDGLTYDLKKDFLSATPIKVTVSSDTNKSFDLIKGFVNKYNEVIDKLNIKISEKRNSDYTPLTEEQKSSMNEDQIEKWETKAKSGLLRGDSIISSTLSNLRSALYDSVSGVGVNLYSIGITTSSYYSDKGKLVIDETKLKGALANKPEEVSNLFTNSSDISYYDAMNSSSARSQRYSESGMSQRFSDIIQDAIRTSTNKDGKKGSLLEKAGIIGDRSEFTSILYKEITDFDKSVTDMNRRLSAKETALYAKFTAMETALNKMNAQSSWISQQFGGNQS